MRRLYLPLLFLGWMVLVIGCAKVEEPVFKSVQNFKIKKLGIQEAQIGLNVVYFNPNKFGVQVKGAVLDVYFDSTFVGKFSQPTLVSVNRKADFAIPLEGSIPLSRILLIKGKDILNKEVEVKAAGTVSVGKAGIFVDREIRYKGRHKLDAYL